MRIIRGEFVGKALIAPSSTLTRPTSDKVRQAIFNVIEHHVDMQDLRGATVLDVFAGTGALGLEALSRGAKHITFVDNQRAAVRNLQTLIHHWNIEDRTTLYAQDILTMPVAAQPVDFIFCDPPYGKDLVNLAIAHLHKQGWIGSNTTIIAEMQKQDDLRLELPLNILQEKKYGDTKVVFFKAT
ncbi:16S rRNA (guanine(966)-N(2))-methyltransferase RsmD [Candidatus Bodocaedibacter vickermanii]|uniref:Ribosomal RNA small subunit methyltransferase D n=1 Tax=Candidatus Bodocaedibacter vickermanii TaxID=2741701 RepID=A0A7L9RTB7_9PROT|nr:Ribosomal RNA small subunit methyltransferase D [Candidatus Paracaedibacteraceae bacterium 'Lake Konstanz']